MQRGSGAVAQPLLGLEQALGVQRAPQPVELREQVALAGHPHVADGEGERRRRGARAGVVVAAAGGDHALAVGERRRASASKSSRHIEHGSAPRSSRSSNQTRARPARRLKTSPKTCTREKPRRRSRSRARSAPTGQGPLSSEPGMPSGRPSAGVAGRSERGGWSGGIAPRRYTATQPDPAGVRRLERMRHDLGTFLAWALRVQRGSGPHAELARQVVLAVLVAQLLAGAQHDGPPHAAAQAPARRPPEAAAAAPSTSRWPAAARAAERQPPRRALDVARRLAPRRGWAAGAGRPARARRGTRRRTRAARAARSPARPRRAPGRPAAAARSAWGSGCAAAARSAGWRRPSAGARRRP